MGRVYLPLRWWNEVDKNGNYWAIVLTSDDLHKEIRCRMGVAFCEHAGGGSILIWAGQPRAELHDTVLHELAHAHHWANGKTSTVGERAIRVVVPRIVESVVRHGWQPPPLPDGYRALAAHARHVRYGRKQREAE